MCFTKYEFLHPEEKPNYYTTLLNYNLDKVFNDWYVNYNVPLAYRDYWRGNVEIEVTESLPRNIPAQTWGIEEKRHIRVRPEYLNAGILAHEIAHSSYALLTITDRANFIIDLQSLKTGIIKYLASKKNFTKGNEVEGHAELYRFLDVPESLRRYYPRLYTY